MDGSGRTETLALSGKNRLRAPNSLVFGALNYLVPCHGWPDRGTAEGGILMEDILLAKPLDDALRILLVEDDRDFQRVFRMLLELDGHEVEVAGDGATALDLLKLQKPDVAIIDLGLPKMDGCELARRLRASRDNDGIFLAALTGYGSEEDTIAVRAAGFNRHLVKPVGIQEIRALLCDVHQELQGQSSRDPCDVQARTKDCPAA